ncbi:MAG TPA: GIY-YIG nuclease family protein [Candidatus Binataceae bacterium]|nr:GIY-YIG nuclease family protein [Candidatus Binataceae bacterium]
MIAPMRQRTFSVYIVASPSSVIYLRLTNDLDRRIAKHREKAIAGFTAWDNVTRLLCFEQFDLAEDAIAREKQRKGWMRAKKTPPFERNDPTWSDQSGE